MPISVEKLDDTSFKVTVNENRTTTHTVTVPAEYCQRLTSGAATAETLPRRSFEFLLEREPNTSILGSFELPLIQQYFPEYERTIKGLF